MLKDIISNTDEKMKKTIESLKRELSSMKAGRANPSMLDRVEADYYGTKTPVKQLANISAPEPRVILIQPFDRTALKDIERAILVSDLGLNPSNDGSVIRLMIPELTEETRKDIVKKVKKTGEESKVTIRTIRRDANDKIKALKKNNELTEDEERKAEDDIQKKTNSFIADIDKILEKKEKEVMSV